MPPDSTAVATTATSALTTLLPWSWYDLLAILAALLAGIFGRAAGTSDAILGKLPAQKITAPTAAFFAAGYVSAVIANIQGHPLTDPQMAAKGAVLGTLAIGSFSTLKNVVQFVVEWKKTKARRRLEAQATATATETIASLPKQ